MNPLLKQSMTYPLSPFALPRSRLDTNDNKYTWILWRVASGGYFINS